MIRFSNIQSALTVATALFIVGACSHYSPINQERFPYQTIYIDPVNNNSFAPNVQVLLDTQIRKKLLESGKLKIAKSLEQADCQLFIRLENYQRAPIGRSSKDPGRIDALNTQLTAIVSFYDNIQGRYLIKDYPLQASERIFFSDENTGAALIDTKEAEYRALPKTVDQLTDSIAQLILLSW